jgi:peroxiredoxin
MKTFNPPILILVFSSLTINNAVHANKQIDASKVLQKTSDKLKSLKNVSYVYFRSINYLSEDYHAEATGRTFLSFEKPSPSSRFKFQIENNGTKIVYNGNEYFSLNKAEKTMSLSKSPSDDSFESLSFFVNSLITLKKALPAVIADKEIRKSLSDTTINNKIYYLTSFVLTNKTLSSLGNFFPITLKRNFTYKVIIDRDTFLPLQVIQTNNMAPNDYTLTTFTEIETEPNAPTELSWYYSTYKGYEQKTKKPLTIITEKTIAPAFNLSYYDSSFTLSSTKLTSKFVLLEFWMKNCGYCIQAVPTLNRLASKFDKTTLQVVGINATDNKAQIKSFYEKHAPQFKTLYDERGTTTTAFGVGAFPQVVLLDNTGKVIYSGDLDEERIEKLITAE